MTRSLRAGVLSGFVIFGASAWAWQLPTHMGLTHRAVQRSTLDTWLRHHQLGDGLYEILGISKRGDDAELLGDLAVLDASLGASPDSGRQPALGWLLAGAAVEGTDIQRIRHHFVDPRTHKGLDERARFSDGKSSIDGSKQGLTSVRAMLAGATFDGTGIRADEWVDNDRNPYSRGHFLAALQRTHTAATPMERSAALARALVCAGSILHVLEAVGDPAHAQGDFAVNYLRAGAPLERFVEDRYGMETPPALQAGAPRKRLRDYFTTDDATGLADQVAVGYGSPGRPSSPMSANADVAEQLLPRIAAESAALLDFLFRGSIVLSEARYQKGLMKIDLEVGALPLGAGEIEIYDENSNGVRTRIARAPTSGGASGAVLMSFTDVELPAGAKKIAVYRGLDAAGEPLVLGAVLNR